MIRREGSSEVGGAALSLSLLSRQSSRIFMSDGGEMDDEAVKAELEKAVALAQEPKALYDDQVIDKKPALSNSMRDRLLQEASSGLDSEKPQTNVILYISVIVASSWESQDKVSSSRFLTA
eukprot:CAMPEP_0194268938 /NCGR_PEP_ID=MMETSP0169-20130528/3197_1 /TAXON_ID=218684 /ORGANISM="Corethron pennatum, Strain L29A3" /LENGTH=120 /DNA_ID=CAMNT_0039010403 /DNA_START=221 /DNA_END=584 /DNA_ORIENTATION=+